MSAAVPQTKVVITGEASGAVKAVQSVTREMGAMQTASLKVMGTLQSLAGIGVVAGLSALTKQAIDAGDALDELQQRTGIAVEYLSKLQYAANISGVSTEQLGKGLVTLNQELASAAAGNKESVAKFERLGISIRDADGRVRGALPVFRDIADAIADLPAGAQQTNAAIDLFGTKVGKDMVLALNGGTEALDAYGTELEQLGGVMSGEMAKAAGQLNENLDKLKKVGGAAGISIANGLLPSLNLLLEKFLAFRKSSASIWDLIVGVDQLDKYKSDAEIFKITEKKIAALEEQADAYRKAGREADRYLLDEIDRQKRLAEHFGALAKIDSGEKEAEDLAAKRLNLQRKLTVALANLEKLRAKAASDADATIADDAKKLTELRLKDAERLRETFRAALKTTIADAEKIRQESIKLQQSADEIRAKGLDAAKDARDSQLSEGDRAYLAQREAAALADSATTNALSAKLAAGHSRTENAIKLADQATKEAERAAKLAEKIADPETRARAIERISEAQANAEEARAAVKGEEAKQLDAQAKTIEQQIASLDGQVGALQQKLNQMALEVDIEQAKGAIAEIQAQLAAIPDVTVKKVEVQVTRSEAVKGAAAADGAGFARGGYTGGGGKYQVAGVVHRGEYVLPQEVVRQRGMLALLDRLRRHGIAALPGFADGGLVGRLSLPQLRPPTPAAARAAAIFNFPGMGRYETSMDAYTFDRLQRDFQREALKKGGRR
jgi:hypothetical protein